jgi:hypothetical protein
LLKQSGVWGPEGAGPIVGGSVAGGFGFGFGFVAGGFGFVAGGPRCPAGLKHGASFVGQSLTAAALPAISFQVWNVI